MQRILIVVFKLIFRKKKMQKKFHLLLYIFFAIQGTQWYSVLHFIAKCNNKLVLTESVILIAK
jgi:hypothetical protein